MKRKRPFNMNHPYFPDGNLLIGKGTLYSVFLVLYGTYREHIINNGAGAGKCIIGLNQLSKFGTVEKSTALKSFNALVGMGLIDGNKTEDGNFSFSVNVNLYESAIDYLDAQITSAKHEQSFLKAFQNNDQKSLSEMGFEVQKGQVDYFSQRPAARSTFPKSGGKFNHPVENSTSFDENELSDAEKVVEFYTTFLLQEFQKWVKIPPLLILQRLGHEKSADLSQILLDLEGLTHDFINAKVGEFSQKVVEFSPSSGGIFLDLPLQHTETQEVANPNKYNKIINKPEKQFFEGQKRDRNIYPFFSVQEVDEIVNNLQLAKTSSLKLFLYNLWGYASDLTHEGYDQEVDEEEQEILSEEDFFDPDGSIITKSDYRQLLLESYEQTAADIEKGCIELDDETVSLCIKEIFPRDMLFKILDWETAALSCREMSVIISKSRIRNIEAKTISAVHQPKTREERRQAAKEGRELMKRLYKANQDKGLYSQLTSIEKIAADVIAQYFAPNPDKEDRAPFILKDGPIMVKENWRALKVQITQAGLKESDFLSTLLNNKGPNDGDQLILQEPLFFWDGLKAVNETYQQTSILDSVKIDE